MTSPQSGRQPVPTRKVLGVSVNRDELQGAGRRPEGPASQPQGTRVPRWLVRLHWPLCPISLALTPSATQWASAPDLSSSPLVHLHEPGLVVRFCFLLFLSCTI